MSPVVRILFVGDMHLGKLPTHIPHAPDLIPHELGPIAAWNQVVSIAVKHQVHAVALAGDLVESSNARFEAYGALESGLKTLNKAQIPVVAVAGNHDTEVLPELAQKIESLFLLGPGGTWSEHTIKGDEDLAVHLVGWSFPQKHVPTSPLPVVGLSNELVHPTFGLLHADLDQTSSRYAPVTTNELSRTDYKAWFLGHTHKPGDPNNEGHPFYLGSLTGLHPGETGAHGPVEVCIDREGNLTMKRLPLAPLRWEELEVDCSVLDAENNDVGDLLLNHLTNWAAQNEDALNDVLAVGFRLTLTGHLEKPEELRKKLLGENFQPKNLITKHSGAVLFVDQIANQIQQKLDLLDLAKADNPEGLLARRLLVLEELTDTIPGIKNPVSIRMALIAQAEEKISDMDRRTVFGRLEKSNQSDEVCQILISAGRRALEAILNQRGSVQ